MAEAWAFARERMNPRRAGLPGLRKAERAIGCATTTALLEGQGRGGLLGRSGGGMSRLQARWVPALLHPRLAQYRFFSSCSVAARLPGVTNLRLSFVHSRWVLGGHHRGDSQARSHLGRGGVFMHLDLVERRLTWALPSSAWGWERLSGGPRSLNSSVAL